MASKYIKSIQGFLIFFSSLCIFTFSNFSFSLFKDGEVATDTVRVKIAHEYDRVGCGLRFEQHFDSVDDSEDAGSFVLVYFTLNGKEVCIIEDTFS